jgi:hypothetical protein
MPITLPYYPLTNWTVNDAAQVNADLAAFSSHTHDGDILQLDGVNSNGGALAFNTTGMVTFNQNVSLAAGKILYVDHIAEKTGAHNIVLDNAAQILRVGIGVAADATWAAYALSAASTTSSSMRYTSLWLDSTAMDAGVGAGILFGGKYTAGGAYQNFGGVAAVKANATTADSAGLLQFSVSPNGGNPQVRLTLDAGGNLATNAGGITSAGTIQGTGLSVGRALTAGYQGDFYAAAADCYVGATTAGTANASIFRSIANGGECRFIMRGTTFAGNTLLGSLAYADAAEVQSFGASLLAIYTYDAVPLYLGTNNTVAITISTAQVVTCASTLRATAIGVGRAPGAAGTIETTADIYIRNNGANGLCLIDNQATPRKWRVTVSNLGILTTTDLGVA